MIRNAFQRLHYPVDIIAQCVRWYLAYRRDAAAALRFFRKAIRHQGRPERVTIDKSGANTAALTTLNADKPAEETITVRQNKYLNNLIEQDHRNIKHRIRSAGVQIISAGTNASGWHRAAPHNT
ncbi:ISYps1 transposase [Serratia sp. FS14]|nr:ISYps1 transposase [Serratia sp. FS14]